MFYILYLASLCKRRRWPDPHYECYPCPGGFTCNVRVHHRDYTSDEVHATQELAREAAAQRAYLICRNISVNESLYQGQLPVNGLPSQPPAQHIPSVNGVSMAMAQPRYVPPTGTIVQGSNGMPKSDQGQIASGRMGNPQGVAIMGHPHIQ
ncbi:hypothetical protein BDZ91DRAFT_652091 [Kalaharituber pfeilii]|nr:hypothetical protein BDZ91DRAFT_652091 [Kalaharituber pfeilii]